MDPKLLDELEAEPERLGADLHLRFPPSFSQAERREFAETWVSRYGVLHWWFEALDVLRVEASPGVLEQVLEDSLIHSADALA